MSNHITLPVQLRTLSGGRDSVAINAQARRNELPDPCANQFRLRELIHLLEIDCPGSKARLLTPDGKLNRFILIYVDSHDARELVEEEAKRDYRGLHPSHQAILPLEAYVARREPLDLRLTGYEEIAILPAIAGG